jgi:SAM-dependent methyltransferase
MNRERTTTTLSGPDSANTLRERFRQCYERIADDDLVTPLEVNKHIRNIPLLRMIGDVRGQKVLDVGSSQGLLLDELKTASLTVCVDIARAYLRVAREHGHQAVTADGEVLPFRSRCFDVVICSGVLEHVLDPETVVRQIERVLAPHGKFIVLVPWEEDLRKYAAIAGGYEFTHLRSFNDEIVLALFKRFRVVRRRGVEPKVERPPNLKLLDALPRFVTSLFRFAGIESLEEWFGRHIPWRIRNRYWKWYWRQLEQFPKWDRLWLWFYPPYHMVFVLELKEGQVLSEERT